MKFLCALSLLFASLPAMAEGFVVEGNKCARYENNGRYREAIQIVAKAMKYSEQELCHLPRLADVYVVDRVFYNERNEAEPHIWLTLHYNEYSCQYFLREADKIVTRKNCYNTI
jgi:hypothetical protein